MDSYSKRINSIPATTWMNIGNIQLQQLKHKRLNAVQFYLCKISRRGKSAETKKMSGSQGIV